MISSRVTSQAGKALEDSVLTTDAARALRSSIAMAAAWVLCLSTGHAVAVMVAAPAAQDVAMLDVRGDYRARLAILLTLTAVLGLSTLAGVLAGNHVLTATLMIGVLALLGGCWRHFSGDYGPHFALGSGLLFLLGLSEPGDWHHARSLMLATCLGGLGGIVVQLSGWFVRPQHALRHAVSEAWVAASDLFAAMRQETDDGQPCATNLAEKESAMRATLDRTFGALKAADSRRRPEFVAHLDEATHLAGRLATRTAALSTALEAVRARPGFATIAPTLDSVLRSLGSAARSAALTIIMHRREQFIALEVRLQRSADLLQVLDTRLAGLDPADAEVAQSRHLLAHIAELLPVVRAKLAETVDYGAPHTGFALRLPELGGMSMRSLGAWLNPPAQLDWVLVRYTLRVAVVLMFAVAIYQWLQIPRGYWIAFTVLVVLQPDFGATRQRLGQRFAGTLAGSVLGSLLLWVRMPVGWFIFFASAMAFCFAYFVRRRYGLAVFFVTLMIVLMTETMMPVHLDFTIARLLSTLAGCTLALLAAGLLWPKWEQSQAPAILAAAMRANRRYFETIAARLVSREPFSGLAVQAKREAERANSRAAASLQRLLGEPAWQRSNVERAAALTTDNQRLTRAITVLAQHLNRRPGMVSPRFADSVAAIAASIEALAGQVECGAAPAAVERLPFKPSANATADEALVERQIAKIVIEIEAMTLAAAKSPAQAT